MLESVQGIRSCVNTLWPRRSRAYGLHADHYGQPSPTGSKLAKTDVKLDMLADMCQASALPSAFSRFTVTCDTLAVRLLSLAGRVEDFHLQECARAGCSTIRKASPEGRLWCTRSALRRIGGCAAFDLEAVRDGQTEVGRVGLIILSSIILSSCGYSTAKVGAAAQASRCACRAQYQKKRLFPGAS